MRRASTAAASCASSARSSLRLAKPAIVAVALFSFLYTFNDFFLPLLYTGEAPHHWVLSIGLSAVPLAAPGAVEPDDGRDAARDGARDRHLLPRAEGVRRGRDADGGEGMKLAVIGAGSTYTPELVSELSQRLDVDELALHGRRRGAARGRRRARGADARPAGYDGDVSAHRDHDARSTAPTSCSSRSASAGRRRACTTRRCRCVRLHRPGDDRRRRFREGDAHRPGRARDRRARRASARRRTRGSSTSRTRSGSSPARCSTPGTARSASATSRSGSSASSRGCSASSRERVVVDQVGLNHLTWVRAVRVDGRDVLPELLAAPRRRARRATSSCRARLLDELGAVPSYYLRYFYAHDACSPSSATATPRAQRSPRSSASCSRSTATRR